MSVQALLEGYGDAWHTLRELANCFNYLGNLLMAITFQSERDD